MVANIRWPISPGGVGSTPTPHFMEPIRIPVSLCPHVVKGKPRGYYVLCQRIFPRGAPILVKQQFVGFCGALVITANHPPQSDSVLKMAIYCPMLGGEGVTWLGGAPIYPMPMGFRAYVSRDILGPTTAEARKVETTGIFMRNGDVFYVKIPLLSGDVMLGRKGIEDGR